MREKVLGLVLVLAVATVASGYAYDPNKAQHSQGYFELATTPVQVTVGGVVGWEYVVDWFTVGAGVTGTTMEMWGFENDKILNFDNNVSWYGSGWTGGAPDPDDRIIMETWGGDAANGYTTLRWPSLETNGDDVWELTAEPWAMDNPWHVPSEYQGGWYAFHTAEVRDTGYAYNGTPITMDLMPIQNFWLSSGAAGLMLTTRIVSTETFGADPGDSPIPQWSPWDDRAGMMPILGDWEAAGGGPVGDFDGDNDVDADDIDILCANMGGDVGTYDMDGDLDVDEDDMIFHVENLVELQDGSGRVGTKRGDFNLDGFVNATDLALMKPNFGLSGKLYADGNANCDTVVNGTDLAILSANIGFAAPTGAVPEPITLGLLSIGSLALLRRKS